MRNLIGLLLVLFTTLPSMAALTNVDRAEFKDANALAQANAGFESGLASWTCSPAITTDTSTPQLIANSKVFAKWDATSAGQNCYSKAVTVPTTGTCEANLTIKNTLGTGTHLFVANDGTNDIFTQPISQLTGALKQRLIFPCPLNGTAKIGLRSVAANEPEVSFDGAWIGVSTSVVNSTYSLPVKSFVPTGSWTTNTTYSGRWWRVNDRAHFEIQVATSGAPTSAALTINFSSVCTADASKLVTTTRNDVVGSARVRDASATVVWNGAVRYNTTTTVEVLSESSTTPLAIVTQAVPMTWAENDTLQASFSIPCDGWSASDVVTADSQRPPKVLQYTSGSGTYIPTPGTTYAHIILFAGGGGGGASGNGTAGTKSTFGTQTALGGSPGINSAAGSGATTSGTLPAGAIRLIANTIGNSGHPPAYTTGGNGGNNCLGAGGGKASYSNAGGSGFANTGGGGAGGGTSTTSAIGGGGGGAGGCDSFLLPNPSASGYAWSVGGGGAGNGGGGSVYPAASGANGSLTIIEYFGAIGAFIANSLSIGAQSGAHEFSASFNCNSSSVITSSSQSGASIGNMVSGVCTLTFPSGMFTSTPWCNLNWESASTSAVAVLSNKTTTSIGVGCFVSTTAASCLSAAGTIQCKAIR